MPAQRSLGEVGRFEILGSLQPFNHLTIQQYSNLTFPQWQTYKEQEYVQNPAKTGLAYIIDCNL